MSFCCFTASMSSTITALPRELVEHIVSHLDKSSLFNCTLLCRYWSQSARPSLFRKIGLHHQGGHGLHDFIAALDSSRSLVDAAFYTQQLSLKGDNSYRVDVTSSEVHHILSNLPSLQTLHLKNVMLRCCPGGCPREISSRSLTQLVLEKITFEFGDTGKSTDARYSDTQCSLVELFNLFDLVTALHMSGVHTDGQRDGALFSLLIGSSQALRTLRSLEIDEEVLVCNEVLRSWGRNLTDLRIHLPSYSTASLHSGRKVCKCPV